MTYILTGSARVLSDLNGILFFSQSTVEMQAKILYMFVS